MPARPPRFARRLLHLSLPRDVREDVAGDLEEMFNRRRNAMGAVRARLWFWRQATTFSAHFLVERLREARRHTDMTTGFSLIDLRLALRMLVRYPGLTIVSVLGMAVGIGIAGGAFAIVLSLLDPSLPMEEGDRMVSIGTWDTATNNREQRLMHDFGTWRTELASVADIGAFRTISRNLIAEGAQPETVSVAEITASGFRVARVSAAFGRYLLPEDERPGAPDVVVLGHEVWRRRFSMDAGIVGRKIGLGNTIYTVVGVMPQGFAFPLNHGFWIPWRQDPSAYEPRTGPAVYVFGRLSPDATLDSAQSELTEIGRRKAAAFPRTHDKLRPRVMPYTFAFTDMDDPENALVLRAIQFAVVMLLIVVCVNVAILVYARTATRQGEIAVRSALGASRRRIVGQLFLEALVLAAVAAIVGVGLVSVGFRYLDRALLQLAGPLPFWMSFRLSLESAVYVVALTVIAAGIVGVVPALKATGRRVHVRLQGLSAGSGSRMQMGRLWTTLIVAQVAVAVALLPATMFHAWNSLRSRAIDRASPLHEFVTSSLVMEPAPAAPMTEESEREFRTRYATRSAELERNLEAAPEVAGATYSLANPGEELAAVLEIEGIPAPLDPVDYNIVEGTKQGHFVRFNSVATDFFGTFGVPVLMGRDFGPADTAIGADGILVNRIFADRMFGGQNALGRRVRYVGRSREAFDGSVTLGRWYQIIGVVADFPAQTEIPDRAVARVYHAAAPGEVYPAMLAVRVRGDSPSTFASRVREISAKVDPALQLRQISTAEDAARREQGIMRLIGIILIAVMLSVVALSGAGIYALMSFTVARRRKEIGIRAALGADPARILAGIFSRALGQLALGAVLGLAGAIGLEQLLEGEMFQGRGAVILPLVACFMTTVGLIAAYVPARRGLGIQPTEALREE